MIVKLRARFLPQDVVEELRQRTFARVLAALNGNDEVRLADGMGAFVNTVCNRVLLEHKRAWTPTRNPALELHPEPPGKAIDFDGMLVSDEGRQAARTVLAKLPAKDRELLRSLLLENQDQDQICRALGLNRDHLRVALCGAKARFRAASQRACVAELAHG